VKLLVAALDAELVAFPPELPGFDRLVTGPGKLQATYALTRALDARRYDEILVVGTAGAIDARLDGDVYEIDAAIQHDVTDIDGIVGQHVSLPPRVELGRDGVTIATGDHFVDDAEAVAVIRPLGAGLVDMETYAYAWVAAQFGVPIRVIKAVSDRAQDDAITDWRTAVTACSAQLREFVLAEYGV
jgi:adenosylhomocysteine nucleosidase